MKATKILLSIAVAGMGLAAGGCAEMFGVGLDYVPSSDPTVYYYDNYYSPNLPWWGVSTPPAPPLWGSVIAPAPPQQPQPPIQNPPQGNRPPQNVNGVPGGNGGGNGGPIQIPNQVGGQQRPGNGGLPSQNVQPPSRNPGNGPHSNNARR